jgi:peptide/nickel transport system permease protein
VVIRKHSSAATNAPHSVSIIEQMELLTDAVSPVGQATPSAGGRWISHGVANPYVRFISRRLVSLAAVLFALLVVTFSIVRLIPGNPGRELGGLNVTQQQVNAINRQLGLDQPFLTQFWKYLINVLHGNLGTSFVTSEPVRQTILQNLPYSLQLALAALIIVLVLAIPLGMLAGALTFGGTHPRIDTAFKLITSTTGAIPEYLLGTFLVFIFAVSCRLLPVAGAAGVSSLILPALAIGLPPSAVLMRIVRAETLNVLAQDYIRTARSKRLPAHLFYGRHVLPNVLTAALTVGGVLFASLIGGAVIVENVFDRPGLGTQLVQAVLSRDYPMIQGTVLFLGLAVVIVNTVVDVILRALDPQSME